MKTFMKKKEDVRQKWYLINASGQTVGRLAGVVAKLLIGKTTPEYTPHVDGGGHVVVINAEKVKFTGKKWNDKLYHYHARHYLGGLKTYRARDMLEKHPEKILEEAVWGMLPKSKLGKKMFNKVKVYTGDKHPHAAQTPETVEVSSK